MLPLKLHTDGDQVEALDRERLMSLRELCALLGIAIPTAERMKAAGKLPPHVELSRTCHRWRTGTVLDWIRQREQAQRKR
jgi:predicted DNA-binding transcriptional regulator AlpA